MTRDGKRGSLRDPGTATRLPRRTLVSGALALLQPLARPAIAAEPELVALASAAHGGWDRWRALSGISAEVRIGGAIWALKGQAGALAAVRVTADPHRQRLRHAPFGGPGTVGAYEPARTELRDAGGRLLGHRDDPRVAFAGHRITTPWDVHHLLYFAGYAMWTYLTVPFLFRWPGFVAEEIAPWREGAEAWRRLLLTGAGAAAVAALQPIIGASGTGGAPRSTTQKETRGMSTLTTRDGVSIHYKDWGPRDGRPVVLSHGWPLNADSWEAQAFHLANHGFRVIAHDRRGHGRSSQPWHGNDMDHYADDLAELIEALDLRDATLFGFSTGGGEIARYVGRHGTARVAQLGLVAAVPPLMVRTEANPDGLPIDVFDGLRAASLADRSKLYRDIASGPFFGFNRPGAEVSQGMIDAFWLQGMTAGHKNAYDSIKAFSETDFTEDLKRFDRPTLIVHGDDDQIVPIDAAARAAKRLVPHAELKVYAGAPHGLADTHKDQLNADMLDFVER
jgi:non-heme chloroperoxidase